MKGKKVLYVSGVIEFIKGTHARVFNLFLRDICLLRELKCYKSCKAVVPYEPLTYNIVKLSFRNTFHARCARDLAHYIQTYFK
jgi:hypothetical protein